MTPSRHRRKVASGLAGGLSRNRLPVIAGAALALLFLVYFAVRSLPGRTTDAPQTADRIRSEPIPMPPRKMGQVSFLGPHGEAKAAVSVEIVDEPRGRELGLMYRRSMGKTFGMLFVFDSSAVQTFWMKNTLLSLDMIFADEKGKVVTIHRNTKPRSLQTYPSTAPVLYVLEVNAGFSDSHGLTTGDRMVWERDTSTIVR